MNDDKTGNVIWRKKLCTSENANVHQPLCFKKAANWIFLLQKHSSNEIRSNDNDITKTSSILQVSRGGLSHSYVFGVQPRELKKKLTDNLFLTAPRIWKPNNGSFYHSYQYVVEIRICGGRDPLFSFPDLVCF